MAGVQSRRCLEIEEKAYTLGEIHARTRYTLARALREGGGDRARAQVLARMALNGLRSSPKQYR